MTRSEIHQRHIARLEAQLEKDQKILAQARSWPLRTNYYPMVERQYPERIEKLVVRINAAYGYEAWTTGASARP